MVVALNEADVLRGRGNDLFAQNKFKEACEQYTKAIEYLQDTKSTDHKNLISCLSNRAETFYKRDMLKQAEKDCRDALSFDREHIKTNYRLCKILIELNEFREPLEILTSILLDKQPDCIPFQELFGTLQRLIKESQGEYDIPTIRKEADNPNFHADFVHKDISICSDFVSEDGLEYTGTKALNNIPEDTLIMSSKAYAMTDGGLEFLGEIDKLLRLMIRKMVTRPELTIQLFSLSSDGPPPNFPDDFDLPFFGDLASEICFHVKNMSGAIQEWYHFEAQMKRNNKVFQDRLKKSESAGIGIWLNESYMNQSMTPNVVWTHLGDQIFVRTSKPIAKGEELCIEYSPGPRDPYGLNCTIERDGRFRSCPMTKYLDANLGLKARAMELVMKTKPGSYPLMEPGYNSQTADAWMSPFERLSFLHDFKDVPLEFVPKCVLTIETQEAILLCLKKKYKEALEKSERAVAMRYNFFGFSFNFVESVFQLVAVAALAKKMDVAEKYMKRIVNFSGWKEVKTLKDQTFLFFNSSHRWFRFVLDIVCKDRKKVVQEVKKLYDLTKKVWQESHPSRRNMEARVIQLTFCM